MDAAIKYIGKVHSVLKRLEDCPRQEHEVAPPAIVEISTPYLEGMKDVKVGSNLLLFTWLDQAHRDVLTTHPRNDPDMPLTGVFSTRSPDRPNPIGIHRVTVTSIESERKFHVSALEVLDQTPIVDIKPEL